MKSDLTRFLQCGFIALPLLFNTLAQAEDWPHWRGPRNDGISAETGLLTQWPADGPKLIATIKGLGNGYSSVSIVNGRIYTMGAFGEDEMVMAFDMASGNKLWSTKVGPLFVDKTKRSTDGPRSTPTYDGSFVYALGGEGDLVCVDATTGKEVWRRNMLKDFNSKMATPWGYSESLLVDGARVLCTPGMKDAAVAALDKKTGNVLWKTALQPAPEATKGKEGGSYASIVTSILGGVPQYIAFTGYGLVSVAPQDGHVLWTTGQLAPGANCINPVVQGDLVFASNAYGQGSSCVQMTASGTTVTATEKYHLDANTFANHHGGVVLIGGYIYGGHGPNNGLPVCIDIKTGDIKWKADKSPGKGSAAVTAADGRLYFRYQDGMVALIEANPTAFKLISQFQQKVTGQAWAYPVISNGHLFLRDHDKLSIYDLKK